MGTIKWKNWDDTEYGVDMLVTHGEGFVSS